MEGRVFENFQKNQRICKIPKMPKIVPKSIQTCFELVLGQIFRKLFLPSVPWRLETSKFFLKIKNFSKFKNAQNRSQNLQTCFEQVLGQNFRKFFLPSVPWRLETSKNFKKKSEKFQNSKKAQNCCQKYPNVF